MSDLELTLRTINLFTTGVLVGALVVFQRSIVPVMVQWPAELSLRLHKDIIRFNPDTYIKPFGAVSLASAGLAMLEQSSSPARSVIPTVVGIVALAGVAVISEALNQPINRRMDEAAEVPADHAAQIGRWARAHLARTVLGVLGFVAYIIGALETP